MATGMGWVSMGRPIPLTFTILQILIAFAKRKDHVIDIGVLFSTLTFSLFRHKLHTLTLKKNHNL
jgi:hypothetical protein